MKTKKTIKSLIQQSRNIVLIFFSLASLMIISALVELSQSKTELFQLMESQAHALLESLLTASKNSLLTNQERELLVRKAKEHRYLISENKLLKEQLREKYKFDSIISQSGEMEEVLNMAGRVAKSKATVLLRGQMGQEKNL